MKTTILGFVALGILGPAVAAQETPHDAAYKTVEAAYNSALAEYRTAMSKVTASPEYKAAIKARDRKAMTKLRSGLKRVPTKDYVVQMQALEVKARGTAAGGQALAWIATNAGRGGQSDVIKESVKLVRTHYMESAHAMPFVKVANRISRVVGAEVYQELLAEIIAKNPEKEAQAWAFYYRAQSNQPRPARRGRPATGDAKAYEADLQKCIKLAKGTPLAARAYAPIFEKKRLQVGMEVPDISGKDLDGIDFKLSDYRGKVVMLDFWGDW